ncbi:MAG: DNRLRE domain-containing protein [Chitinivibrionales bacterium]|nr:DNRLRE domain-containing protein [Chitinivibrionales bacterium]
MVLRFDLNSIPTTAIIKKAVLSLYAIDNYGGNSGAAHNGPKSIYALKAAWSADKVTWVEPWSTTPGGNFDKTALAKRTDTTVRVWEDFEVTAAVASQAQNNKNNNGFIIKFDTYTPPAGLIYCSPSAIADSTCRPKLTITFEAASKIDGPKAHQALFFIIKRQKNGLALLMQQQGPFKVRITDVSGATIHALSGAGKNCFLPLSPIMARGVVVVSVASAQNSGSQKFILAE